MGQLTIISLPLICGILINMLGYCEMSIYPGLRRKPLQQNLQPFEMSSDFLAQLMEENARRRLQQQFEQQVELINMQMNRQRQRQQQRERERYRQLQAMEESEEDYGNGNGNANGLGGSNQYDQYDNPNVEFSYKYAPSELTADELSERIPFAVGPSDPRFYEEDARTDSDANLDSQAMDEYEEYVPAESQPAAAQASLQPEADLGAAPGAEPERAAVLAPAQAPADSSKLLDSSSTATFHRIKPQSAAAVAGAGLSVVPMKPAQGDPAAGAGAESRHDISALIAKLQKEGKSGAVGSDTAVHAPDSHVVVRQHLGMEGEMGMYVVALVAGVSAAITVGLIALGIAWYTLHNKAKAAADVEYPAYGVTGPNKDISPSGDRKLAQSAQMYHYQHQKQQIIAMENRQAVEGHCGLSDVESDDDNEEGDYTVYECPGLAPTGEMEVKNPLFLDETPVTPAASAATATATSTINSSTTNTCSNMTQATPQQPQTVRKSSGKATGATAPPSDENARSSKKNKK